MGDGLAMTWRKRAPPVMSLRGAQRRSNLLVIVGTERDGEIAAASLGWPRNDIEEKGATSHVIARSAATKQSPRAH